MVSISGMTVSLRTDLRFPITGQQGHGSRNIQNTFPKSTLCLLKGAKQQLAKNNFLFHFY